MFAPLSSSLGGRPSLTGALPPGGSRLSPARSPGGSRAQNAKKIADRKAKKPPTDPPLPPEHPEPHPDVGVLKTAILEALAVAEAKLAEVRSRAAGRS